MSAPEPNDPTVPPLSGALTRNGAGGESAARLVRADQRQNWLRGQKVFVEDYGDKLGIAIDRKCENLNGLPSCQITFCQTERSVDHSFNEITVDRPKDHSLCEKFAYFVWQPSIRRSCKCLTWGRL